MEPNRADHEQRGEVLTERKLWEAPSERERRWLVRVVGAACLLFLCAVTIADPDLWGHTLYGLRAIELGVLAEATDPFSYTAPGAEWINHEWLTELALGHCWRLGGNVALVLWRNFWLCLLFGMVDRCLNTSTVRLPGAWLLLLFNTECLANFVVYVRPQLATYVGFLATLILLRRNWDSLGWSIWTLPFLMVPWTNFHGGFLAGVALTWLFATAAVVRGWLKRNPVREWPTWLGVAVAVSLATLINPYGVRLHGMLWDHLCTEQLIVEWRPLWSVTPSVVYFVPFGLSLLGLLFSRKWQWIDLAVLLVVGWQAASHSRHVALFCLATWALLPVPLSDALHRLFPELHARWSKGEWTWWRWTSGATIVAFLTGLHVHGTWPLMQEGLRPWDVAVETRSGVPGMPVAAVAEMRRRGIHGHLVTNYGWGQFVLWWLWPDVKVAFDGRYRTVYPLEIENAYLALQQAGDQGLQTTPLLDKFPTTWVLAPRESGLERTMRRRGDWCAVYEDDQCALFTLRQQVLATAPDPATEAPVGARPILPRWVRFPGDLSATH
jgi:hypothetical protein